MKRCLFIFCISILSMVVLHAQRAATHGSCERDDVASFLRDVTGDSINTYLHQPLSKFYERIADSPYKILHMSTMSVGPWSMPDGIERMNGVILYNKTYDELMENKKVFIVYISLDVWLDNDKIWKNLPDENWMEGLQERTKNMRVTNIMFEETTISSDSKLNGGKNEKH